MFENEYFYCTYSIKTSTGYFLKIAKINSQQKQTIRRNGKNQFPQNTKSRRSAKINSRKNFVPHGRWFISYISIQLAIFVKSICDPIRLLLRVYRKAKGAGSEPLGFLVGHHNTNYVSFKKYTGEEQDLAKNNDNDDNNK